MKYDDLIQTLLKTKSELDQFLLSNSVVLSNPWSYIVIVVVGLYAIAMVAHYLYEWFGALQYFGFSAFGYRRSLLRIKRRESIVRKLSLHYMLPTFIAVLMLYMWHLTDANMYVALFLLFFALTLMSPYLWPIPPVVLYLGTSRPQRSQFRRVLSSRIMPARVATLLDPNVFGFMAQVWAYDDYRTRETGAWEESVIALASIVRAIVLDGRDNSYALEQEALWMLDPKYSQKLFVITGPGGGCPLVDRLSELRPQKRDLLLGKCMSESTLYRTVREMKRLGNRPSTFGSTIRRQGINIDDLAERCDIRPDEIYRYLRLTKWALYLHDKGLIQRVHSSRSSFGVLLKMTVDIKKIVKFKLDCGSPNTTQAYQEIEGDLDRMFSSLVQNGHPDLTEEVAEEVEEVIWKAMSLSEVTSRE